MQENACEDERLVQFANTVSTSQLDEVSLVLSLDQKTLQCLESEKKTVLELLATEEYKTAALRLANRVLRSEVWEANMEAGIAHDEKDTTQQGQSEALADLAVTEENARLWQMLAEKNLDTLSIAKQSEIQVNAFKKLRKQFEFAGSEAKHYREKVQIVREDAEDLEYNLYLHQRRLKNDEGSELSFYLNHFEQVQKTFDENNEPKAVILASEQRFTKELQADPLKLLRSPRVHQPSEEEVGPDHIAQTIALYRAQAGTYGSENAKPADRVQAIYDFGAAVPPDEREPVDMPVGQLERKTARESMQVGESEQD